MTSGEVCHVCQLRSVSQVCTHAMCAGCAKCQVCHVCQGCHISSAPGVPGVPDAVVVVSDNRVTTIFNIVRSCRRHGRGTRSYGYGSLGRSARPFSGHWLHTLLHQLSAHGKVVSTQQRTGESHWGGPPARPAFLSVLQCGCLQVCSALKRKSCGLAVIQVHHGHGVNSSLKLLCR